MLALTTLENSVTAADLFIQRALELDEPYYRELPAEAEQLKVLKGLFARCRTLDIVPGDGLSKDVFSLNFSTMIVEQLRSGFMPHPNATSNDLQIIALANGCEPLGDPMAVEDFGVGGFPHVTQLWMMVDPTDKKHELDDLLEYELNGIRNLLPRVKLLVPALDAMKWGDYWDKLFDLVRDVRRLGAGEGQALMRTERTDVLAKDMYAINRRIDAVQQEVARQRLEADVFTRESGARAGIFVDPLLNDDMRDQGLSQTAAVVNGVLTLPIEATATALPNDVAAPTANPWTPSPLLAQPLRTGSMKVNPYMAFDPLPGGKALKDVGGAGLLQPGQEPPAGGPAGGGPLDRNPDQLDQRHHPTVRRLPRRLFPHRGGPPDLDGDRNGGLHDLPAGIPAGNRRSLPH
mgnify:CR=1 FL=1